jgi:hypothetical protein
MRIGGEGGISVFQQHDADHYDERGRIKTVSGAQTGYFSPELDKLYVAVRKHESLPAEIRVYAPKAIDSERATARDSFSTTQPRESIANGLLLFVLAKAGPLLIRQIHRVGYR